MCSEVLARKMSPMNGDRYDYDVRCLTVGDSVEVYVGPERRWQHGTFGISTAGTAFVEIGGRVQFRFEQAMLMGLRRVVAPPKPDPTARRTTAPATNRRRRADGRAGCREGA